MHLGIKLEIDIFVHCDSFVDSLLLRLQIHQVIPKVPGC